MIDAATRDVLQQIVRRESRSLLSYIGDAFPWGTSREDAALARLHKIVHAEADAVGDLGRYLIRKKAPLGYIGSYASNFTTINFVALDYVVAKLVGWEKKSIADLERDLPGIHDGESRAHVEKLLALKRENLFALEALAVKQPISP